MPTLPDGRTVPPPHAGERAMLESWLDFHRETLEVKCRGLDDRQLRTASAEPSRMTLLGLVQHAAEVERNWFQRVFAGLDVKPVYPGNTDGFTLSPRRGLDEATAVWRREIARGREVIAQASLDDAGKLSDAEAALVGGGPGLSLRWILVHMIEEYARHNGHADLLRERIDGVTGP
ncbi:DinB family protein [Streptomyces sp. NBC_01754]|uniref:DinB family protein n=1 Tax=Streptomyces sp. NBC_01754 TaxID=2975930 RepID=UPI002DD7EC6E|nr:DinB family protein [Streptomyces sp. NBC_01754]WSC93105.1 DinB family protein [Streptomyces sp. NBC_01754]